MYDSISVVAADNNLVLQEKPKQIKLLNEAFSPANGLLTPTMKMKRNVLKDNFEKDIENLYSQKVMIQSKASKRKAAKK